MQQYSSHGHPIKKWFWVPISLSLTPADLSFLFHIILWSKFSRNSPQHNALYLASFDNYSLALENDRYDLHIL
jgi:hypothetical protein